MQNLNLNLDTLNNISDFLISVRRV